MNGRNDRIREACWFAERLFAGRHYRAVLGLCTRALEEEGDDPALYLLRARALLAGHRDAEAAADVERARAGAPGNLEACLLLAEIALRRRDPDAARRLLAVARRRAPADPRAAELTQVVSGWFAEADRIAAGRRVVPIRRAA